MCYTSSWLRSGYVNCQVVNPCFFLNFIYVLSNWTYHFNLTIQGIMDPSRNFSRYRNLIKSDTVKPPLIPIFPMVSKDLSFIHIGNKTKKGDLVNFEKMRLVAKESLPLLRINIRKFKKTWIFGKCFQQYQDKWKITSVRCWARYLTVNTSDGRTDKVICRVCLASKNMALSIKQYKG